MSSNKHFQNFILKGEDENAICKSSFFSRENQPTWNNKHMLSFLKHVIIMTKQTSSMRSFWLTLTSAVMNKSVMRERSCKNLRMMAMSTVSLCFWTHNNKFHQKILTFYLWLYVHVGIWLRSRWFFLHFVVMLTKPFASTPHVIFTCKWTVKTVFRVTRKKM